MGVDDPSHAFYLGYELMKAKTALTLSKAYRQDQALDWGFLTEPEVSHRDRPDQAGEGDAVILEGIVTTLDPDGTAERRPDGPARRARHAAGSSSGPTGPRRPTGT